MYNTIKENKGEALKSVLKNFVRLLAKRGLFSYVPKIINDFNKYYNETEGIIEVKVTSALDLSEAEKKDIRNQIKNLTDKNVELITETNSKLIGGIKIAFADNLIDGSIKTQLENLKKQLLVNN